MLEAQPLAQILSVEQLDEMLLAERECGIVLRFGRGTDPRCSSMDAALRDASEELDGLVHAYSVDIGDVGDYRDLYELYDPCTLMMFFDGHPVMLPLQPFPDVKLTSLDDLGRGAEGHAEERGGANLRHRVQQSVQLRRDLANLVL